MGETKCGKEGHGGILGVRPRQTHQESNLHTHINAVLVPSWR